MWSLNKRGDNCFFRAESMARCKKILEAESNKGQAKNESRSKVRNNIFRGPGFFSNRYGTSLQHVPQ